MFAQRIKSLRRAKQLSQEQLAKTMSLSRSTITAYETNHRSPDMVTLQRFADYFDVSADYILGRTDSHYDINFLDLIQPDLFRLLPKIAELTPELQETIKVFIEFTLTQAGKYRGAKA